MSELAKMLRREQRRHVAMSMGLIAAAVIAGTMVTNERGIFSNVIGGGPLSALERAFAAIADADRRIPTLFHRSASSSAGDRTGAYGDEPFDVLGTPADLRRRLMEALGGDADPDAAADSQTANLLDRPITPDQLALNETPAQLQTLGDTTPSLDPATRTGTVGGAPGPSLIVQQPGTPAADADLPTGAVPEPAAWALLIGGLGVVGGALRRLTAARRRRAFLAAE